MQTSWLALVAAVFLASMPRLAAAQWTTWQSLPDPPSPVASEPILAADFSQRLSVFVVGSDGAVYRLSQQTPGGAYGAWVRMSPAGLTLSASLQSRRIAVGTNEDGRLELFAWHGSKLSHSWQLVADSDWGPWVDIDPPSSQWSGADLVVGFNGDGRLEVFAKNGFNSHVFHIWQTTPNGGWAPSWHDLEGPGPSRQINGRLVWQRNLDGRQELFSRASVDDQIWSVAQAAVDQGWRPWVAATASGGAKSDPVAVAQNKDGRLEVFSQFAGDVWNAWQTSAGTWGSGWADLGSPPGVVPTLAIARLAQGRLAAFSWSSTGLYENSQTAPGSGWGGWQLIRSGPLSSSAGHPQSLVHALNKNGQSELLALANGKLFTIRATSPELMIRGSLACTAPNRTPDNSPIGTGLVTNRIGAAGVQVDGFGRMQLDQEGNFILPAYNELPVYKMRVYYEGDVAKNLLSGATPLQVMDDGHNTRSDVISWTPKNLAPFIRRGANTPSYVSEMGLVIVQTTDCELWRLGAEVLADFHSVRGSSPPAGRLRIKRWENVIVGTPLTYYDYITVPTDFLTLTEYPGEHERKDAIFHEFAHSVRHVADGSKLHWDLDNTNFIYAQDHDFGTLHDSPFAFNEGWANYWAAVRVANNGLPSTTCPPDNARDWNELKVASRLVNLRDELKKSPTVIPRLATAAPGTVNDVLDSAMVQILFDNPGAIHSLSQFEGKFAGLVPGFVAPQVPLCPPGFIEGYGSCRRDADIMWKPGRGGCPCAYHDVAGIVCYRNLLIFLAY